MTSCGSIWKLFRALAAAVAAAAVGSPDAATDADEVADVAVETPRAEPDEDGWTRGLLELGGGGAEEAGGGAD
jgi:hypothetical protein